MLRQTFLLLFAAAAAARAGLCQRPSPLDLMRINDTVQFSFLAPLVRDVDVVSLGESIHLTREFPLVRRGIVQYLARTSGFRLVAFEGSAVDLWATQDRLLASNRTQADAAVALGGLFPIWNTVEVRDLVEFAVASWSTAQPLYLTAYDVQPGSGKETRGSIAFDLLAERLSAYGPPPPGVGDSPLAPLSRLANACHSYGPRDAEGIDTAIDNLNRWIVSVAPIVAQRYPTLPHAAVLRLLPENLRASHRLCRVMAETKEGWNRYKATRDAQAGQYALALRKVAPGGKVIVWAHLSHVGYNGAGGETSIGRVLRDSLGSRVYTIMPLAQGGWAPLIYSDVNDDIAYAFVHGDRGPLGARLSAIGTGDYFVDVRPLSNDSLFTSRHPVWVESGFWNVAAARDFDAIIWIRSVHGPSFLDARMSKMFMVLSVPHYAKSLGVPLVLLAIVIVGWVFVRRRGRRAAIAAA